MRRESTTNSLVSWFRIVLAGNIRGMFAASFCKDLGKSASFPQLVGLAFIQLVFAIQIRGGQLVQES